MQRDRMCVTGLIVLLILGLGGWRALANAEPAAELLPGTDWQQMSHDNKVVYILGIGNFLDLESALKDPLRAGQKSFVPILNEGLRGKSINVIVEQIDAYYQSHPQQLQHSVLEALMQAVVFPALQATQYEGRRQ